MKNNIPNEPYIDVGENSYCAVCNKRLCTCEQRQDGTWENNLPIIFPEKKKDEIIYDESQ